jgi:hypothetical protein
VSRYLPNILPTRVLSGFSDDLKHILFLQQPITSTYPVSPTTNHFNISCFSNNQSLQHILFLQQPITSTYPVSLTTNHFNISCFSNNQSLKTYPVSPTTNHFNISCFSNNKSLQHILFLQQPITSKNKKYHIFGTFLKFNMKIIERGKFDTPNKQIHGLLIITWRRTEISIKNGGDKLVVWAHTLIWLLFFQCHASCVSSIIFMIRTCLQSMNHGG